MCMLRGWNEYKIDVLQWNRGFKLEWNPIADCAVWLDFQGVRGGALSRVRLKKREMERERDTWCMQNPRSYYMPYFLTQAVA